MKNRLLVVRSSRGWTLGPVVQGSKRAAQGTSGAEAHGLNKPRQCTPIHTFLDFQSMSKHSP